MPTARELAATLSGVHLAHAEISRPGQ